MSTLANWFLEATFKPNKKLLFGHDADSLRAKLYAAQRFVLDPDMSGFMADLSCAFIDPHSDLDTLRNNGAAAVEDARRLALLPFDVTWIEYDSLVRAQHTRQHSCTPSRISPVEGWLCWKTPGDTFHAQTITSLNDGRCVVLPVKWHWRIDEQPTGWPRLKNSQNLDLAHLRPLFGRTVANTWLPVGFEYDTDKIGFSVARWVGRYEESTAVLINEWKGDLRYLLTLLACMNSDSVPTINECSSRPNGRIAADGQSPAYLDFTTVKIKLPKNVSSAEYAVQIANRNRHRRHEVRSFLRKDRQGVKRIQVRSHFRGDASLGWVVHEQYDVQAAPGNKEQPA